MFTLNCSKSMNICFEHPGQTKNRMKIHTFWTNIWKYLDRPHCKWPFSVQWFYQLRKTQYRIDLEFFVGCQIETTHLVNSAEMRPECGRTSQYRCFSSLAQLTISIRKINNRGPRNSSLISAVGSDSACRGHWHLLFLSSLVVRYTGLSLRAFGFK